MLTARELRAALWLLPASLLGVLLGTATHRRLSEWNFAAAVSVLLIVLGVLLAIGAGR